MKTLVMGATGQVGHHVAQLLLSKGEQVRCMSRSAEKLRQLPEQFEGVVADLDLPGTLPYALDGVENLFLVVPFGPEETERGLAAVKAAKQAGVRKIIYLSMYMPEGTQDLPCLQGKAPIEKAVRDSDIAFTILRPNVFFQNDMKVIGVMTGFGIYPTPLGAVGLSRIDARDVAECAVNALLQQGHEGFLYGLHGPEPQTGEGVAKIYANYLGKKVRYAGNDLGYWIKHVRNIMPEWRYRDMRTMYRYYQTWGMVAPEAELEKQQLLLGRAPRKFADFAEALVYAWRKKLALAA